MTHETYERLLARRAVLKVCLREGIFQTGKEKSGPRKADLLIDVYLIERQLTMKKLAFN